MINLPYLTETKQNTVFNQEFRGYNHNLRISQGELYDMKNMSTDDYPVITTRQGERIHLDFDGKANGVFEYAHNKLMVAAGKNLYVNIDDSTLSTYLPDRLKSTSMKNGKKYFAQIGTKTVIMPDKKVYDYSEDSLINIERTYETVTGTSGNESQRSVVRKVLCDLDGNEMTVVTSDTAPSNLTNYWRDTTTHTLKKYSASTGAWVVVDTPYMRIMPSAVTSEDTSPSQTLNTDVRNARNQLSAFFGTLEPYDTVSISFSTTGANPTDYVVYNTGTYTYDSGTSMNYIVVVGDPGTAINNYTVKRECPDLTHICSMNNRVWGVDNNKHEIYCCKLGSPTQWKNYAGLASDSYTIQLGSHDKVTGCAAYNNYVYFFTETKMIKIYGDYPANFHAAEIICDGVVDGGDRTLVVVENVLYYVSPNGVMAFDGSFPTVISSKFEPNFLKDKTVVAGRDGTKYCLSVSTWAQSHGDFIYDTLNGLWVKGGDQIYMACAVLDGALAFLNRSAQLIVRYDRSLPYDQTGAVGRELFSLERKEGDSHSQEVVELHEIEVLYDLLEITPGLDPEYWDLPIEEQPIVELLDLEEEFYNIIEMIEEQNAIIN